MEKASRLFITADFSTFRKWFIDMFTAHTAFMNPEDSQIAAFTNTSWVLREEEPEHDEFNLDYRTWYTSYGELWSEKNWNFSKFPENLSVVYFDENLDENVKNFLIKKIERMSDKISIYTYPAKDGGLKGATAIRYIPYKSMWSEYNEQN